MASQSGVIWNGTDKQPSWEQVLENDKDGLRADKDGENSQSPKLDEGLSTKNCSVSQAGPRPPVGYGVGGEREGE